MGNKYRIILVLSLLLFTAVMTPAALYAYHFLYPAYAASQAAEGFFSSLCDNDIEGAFQYVAYFDRYSDVAPSISYGEAQRLWVDRVQALKDRGTYLKSYGDIKTGTDDGYPVGDVTVTVIEGGRADTYRARIHFAWSHSKLKIQAVYPPVFSGKLEGFEYAISGSLKPD